MARRKARNKKPSKKSKVIKPIGNMSPEEKIARDKQNQIEKLESNALSEGRTFDVAKYERMKKFWSFAKKNWSRKVIDDGKEEEASLEDQLNNNSIEDIFEVGGIYQELLEAARKRKIDEISSQ